jgi:hypothetical protein
MSRFESLDGLLAHDDNFRQFFTTLIGAASGNDHLNATSTANVPFTGGVDDDVAGEVDGGNNQNASGNADMCPTSTPDGGTSAVDTTRNMQQWINTLPQQHFTDANGMQWTVARNNSVNPPKLMFVPSKFLEPRQTTSLSPKSPAAYPARGRHTSEAIERIVGTYVELRNRKALEDLRTHRHRLITELKSLTCSLDVSSLIKQLEPEIEFIDAGLAKLNTEATI